MNGPLQWLYLRLINRLYGEWSGMYDVVSFVVSLGQWHAWRLRALAYIGSGPVLEIGPGTGHLLSALAGSGRLAVGADASPEMAARCAARLREQGARPAVVQAQSQALPFAAGTFAAVVSTFPAGYILEARTIQEIARVAAAAENGQRAGRVVVLGLWVYTPSRILRWIFLPFYGRPGLQSISAFAALLREAGLCPAIAEEAQGDFRVGTIVATSTGG